jgi:hypothetical protein
MSDGIERFRPAAGIRNMIRRSRIIAFDLRGHLGLSPQVRECPLQALDRIAELADAHVALDAKIAAIFSGGVIVIHVQFCDFPAVEAPAIIWRWRKVETGNEPGVFCLP